VVAQSPTTWLYGALAAALTGIILATSLAPGRIKQFNIVTIVCFSALTIAGIGLGAQDQDWMNTYSTTLSSGVLAVVVLGSLLVVPLSEQYARESTPTDLWHQPAFRYRHRLLTLTWGLVLAVIAVSGLVAATLPSTSDWTNWVLPILLLAATIKFTATYPHMSHERPLSARLQRDRVSAY